MFNAILIANRGEIACRIIKSARLMGIRTVAIYSEADRNAVHVDMASDAVLIGPAPAIDSYLNIDAILDAIDETGADAVHPGFGFLSENAEFAEILGEEGVKFIGPNPDAIRLMGDKISAKQLASEIGVPTIPGTSEPVVDLDVAAKVAKDIGYPVLLKASAGGGGKGMRLVEEESQLEEGLRASSAEAEASFGDDRVFIEKFVTSPRHIEIQVLADQHGNIVHLGERECSIQRRHQKVIEEAPSTFVDEELRYAMGEQALTLARAVDYVSAGTVEFIVDSQKNFFFLEMNTRLQVEHAVTEEVTGLDLVEQMIRIAAGEELGFKQDDVVIQGWSIESRVYAEDPVRGFLPSTGRLASYREPVTGVFGRVKTVRVDSGVAEGDMVTRFYDPMLAKLVTVGRTRNDAITRMQWALDEYLIQGVGNNIGFLAAMISHPRFRVGDITTNFIAEEFGDRFLPTDAGYDDIERLVSVAASVHVIEARRNAHLRAITLDGDEVEHIMPNHGRDLVVVLNGEYYTLAVEFTEPSTIEVRLANSLVAIVTDWAPGQPLFIGDIDGEATCLRVERHESGYRLSHRGFLANARVLSATAALLLADLPEHENRDGDKTLLSPMPGLIVSIEVVKGQEVRVGDPLVIIEAMKMENMLVAERDGKIASIGVKAGESVELDQVLLEFL